MMLNLAPLLLLSVLPQEEPQEPVVPAEEAVAEGHSIHGEAFDEGPRQAAYLMAEPAAVEFPITTSDPLAQKMFDVPVTARKTRDADGVLLYHIDAMR